MQKFMQYALCTSKTFVYIIKSQACILVPVNIIDCLPTEKLKAL